MAKVKLTTHWTADRRLPDPEKAYEPGDVLDLPADLARMAVAEGTAVYVSQKEAKAADDPDGRTETETREDAPVGTE